MALTEKGALLEYNWKKKPIRIRRTTLMKMRNLASEQNFTFVPSSTASWILPPPTSIQPSTRVLLPECIKWYYPNNFSIRGSLKEFSSKTYTLPESPNEANLICMVDFILKGSISIKKVIANLLQSNLKKFQRHVSAWPPTCS